ncbi:alpha-tocopherol transfer protein-like [Caerostris extrusa]|uniref:Alpha-tocopherol transfer protein-like n=1 Tax=Caerostris extrusa TaxID=172846 RepID=A0AAV4NVI6_CAEEX|nr:alpha-tocopherol transfer protein-like [Caerostris extrusa]
MPYISTWRDELTPEMLQIAEKELGETPEVRKTALKALRKLISEEGDFCPQTDETFLLRFLRAKKYDVKKSFVTLRNYYIFKARYAGLLTDFRPTELKSIMEMNNLLFLPSRHPCGATIGCLRMGYFDMEKVSAEQIFATCLVGLEYILQFEPTQVCGYILIFDLSKFSLKILRHFASPTFLFRCVRLVQDCIPCRAKGFHVINEPFYINIIFSIIKTLLSEKLTKRIHFHGSNIKNLHQHLPPDLLPTEFGGTIGSMASHCKELLNKIIGRESAYERLIKFGFQEKKIQHFKKQDSRSVFLK